MRRPPLRLPLPLALSVFLTLLVPGLATAQFVDPSGRWRTLETPHFRVHVRAGQQALGRRAAGEAESAWAALAALLPPPRRRVDLVLADHADDANGLASTYPLPRVVVFAAPPAGDPQLGYYDRWLRLVITHELAHVFHLDPARGWWGLARKVFGRAPGLFPDQYAPTWLIEGMAVFYESRLTGGGRLESGFHRAVTEAQAAEREALPLDAAGSLSPRWPGGIRAYAFGATFFDTLSAARGDSVVARFARGQSAQLLPYLQIDRAMRRSAGISASEMWRRWQEKQARSSRFVLSQGTGEIGEEPSRVLEGQRLIVAPRAGPGGRVLLARYDGRDGPRLAVLEAGAVRDLARLNAVSGIAWDTGGAALVAQLEFTDPYTIRSDLWRFSLDGRGTRLTRGARLLSPDVASDGAIVAVRLVSGGNELVLIQGDSLRVLAAGPGLEWAQPRFSPDGGTIAVVRVEGGRHDVVLMDRSGSVTRALTRDVEPDLMPAFTPDGRVLVWSREVEGRPQIVGTRLESGEWFTLSAAPFAAWAPEPAGDSLLYLSYHAGGLSLVAAPWREVPMQRAPPAVAEAQEEGGSRAAASGAGEVMEHGYRPWPAVLPQYWLPYITTVSGAGSWLGAFTSSADPLGRHAWAATLQVGSGSFGGRRQLGIAYVYAGIKPLVFDAGYGHDELLALDQQLRVTCCVPDESAALGVTALARRWRRSGFARAGLEYDRTGRAERWGVVATAGVSGALRPALAISLQEGARFSATLRRRWRVDTDRVSTQVSARGAVYRAWRTGGFARQVTGLRASAGFIAGSDPVLFGVGGGSGEAIDVLPLVALGSSARTFPMRGARPGELAGRQVVTWTAEHRLPLALVGRGLPWLLPAQLDRLSLSAFLDGAATWAGGVSAAYGSVGAELVADLGVGYDIPVRLRLGLARRLDRSSSTVYLAAGSAF